MVKIPANPFILVDGSSYLFRAYHALPPLNTSKGQPTGAIYGVVNMLRRLIKDYQPEKMAVVFDSKQKNFRHQLYEPYKANRTVMPDDLQQQIAPLFEVIKAMGLTLVVIEGLEADDIIGTLARKAKSSGLFTLISTGDKDFAQLVDDDTYLINTMSQEVYDRNRVIEKFEIPPEQITEYFALIGDSVDNIPGIPSVGPKTAVKWLKTYGNLAKVIESAPDITGKVGEKLREHISLLPLYQELVTIQEKLPINIELSHLSRSEQDFTALQQLFTDLEFKTWLRDLLVLQHGQAQESLTTTTQTTPSISSQLNTRLGQELPYEIIMDEKLLQAWIKKMTSAKRFVLELKTNNPLDSFANIIGIAFAIEPGEFAYLPLAHHYAAAPKQLNLEKSLEKLRPLLEDHQIEKIGSHLKIAVEILANHGINLQGIAYDTMLESYVLNSTVTKHELDACSEYYLGFKKPSYAELYGKGAKQLSFEQVDVLQAGKNAILDAAINLCLHQHLWPKLEAEPTLLKIYKEIELPFLSILAQMERTGVLIDPKILNEQSLELGKRCAELERQAYEEAGQEFNLNSPKQLQEILFEKLNLPILEKTPTGQPSTAENVLQTLAENYPLPKIILEYRSLSKLKSTYTDSLPEQINPNTGRVHTSYLQALTSTGRLSSVNPNLQNIPIRSQEGRKIRTAFKARKGYKIVAADYSQIELRIMAHMSQDQALIQAFNADDDIHQSTASAVYGVPLEAVTPLQRRNAKIINFGLMYGMSHFGLSRQLGLDKAHAEQQIERYFTCFPGVKKMMDNILTEAKDKGFVETLLGRRLYLPYINVSNMMQRKAAERAAINAPMQGTNADIIKLAMIELGKFSLQNQDKIRMIMQVHDELVFEIEESALNPMMKKIKSTMENIIKISVPLRVDIAFGDSWEEAH